MPSPVRSMTTAVAALALLTGSAAAQAPRWPQSPGGALAARAIGFMCPDTLTNAEIADLDLYLARVRVEARKKREQGRELLVDLLPKLEAEYLDKYRNPEQCTPAARAMAQEAVKLIRDELKRQPD